MVKAKVREFFVPILSSNFTNGGNKSSELPTNFIDESIIDEYFCLQLKS